ncbi:MAG: class I SAM-dependent methyltransferase [Boseongicola sp.]
MIAHVADFADGETNELDALFKNPTQLSRIRNEARFGLSEMAGILADIPDGGRVVEVGSGTGYLIAILARRYPHLKFEAIEPVGEGFQEFEDVLGRIAELSPNVTLHRAFIENYMPQPDAPAVDCAFSVNVFEHLNDWRAGVDKTMSLLSQSGRAVVICPNYAVPYEPHFGIPVLGTPSLTARVFAAQIAKVEGEANSSGLWDSLNFISAPALARHARKKGYRLTFDKSIMARMFERFDHDPDFAARQSGVLSIARLARRIGVGKLLSHAPAFASPYMKATISPG